MLHDAVLRHRRKLRRPYTVMHYENAAANKQSSTDINTRMLRLGAPWLRRQGWQRASSLEEDSLCVEHVSKCEHTQLRCRMQSDDCLQGDATVKGHPNPFKVWSTARAAEDV